MLLRPFRRCGQRGLRFIGFRGDRRFRLAERYAAALFELADERRMLDEVAS